MCLRAEQVHDGCQESWRQPCKVSGDVTILWMGFLALLVLKLIRRHGWEYVPLLLLVAGVRWYAGDHIQAAMADGLTLASVAGVWLITGFTRV